MAGDRFNERQSTRQPIDKRWQLDDVEQTDNQWKLLDSEQEIDDRWQLQPEEHYTGGRRGAAHQGAEWQPIDYMPEERSGGNWILPSLVLVAVLAIAGYMALAGLGQLGLTNFSLSNLALQRQAQATPTVTPEAAEPEVAVLPQLATATLAPTPTTQQAESSTAVTPAPAPILVEKRLAAVKEQYGINARSVASKNGEVLQVVAQNTQLPIWDEEQNADGKWYQVSLPDNKLAWVVADFVEVSTQQVAIDDLNQLRTQVGLEALPVPGIETAQAAEDSSVVSPAPTVSAGEQITALVTSPAGLNVRSQPSTTGESLLLVESNQTLSVVGRSEDGQWLQVQLADGRLGWAARQFLQTSGNVDVLPAATPSAGTVVTVPADTVSGTTASGVTVTTAITAPVQAIAAPAVTATQNLTSAVGVTNTAAATISVGLTSTAAITQVASITPSGVLTQSSALTPTSNITAKVVWLSGAKVRAEPNPTSAELATLSTETVVPALARSQDSAYIQVRLQDGRTGWVRFSVIELSAGLDDLPIAK
jgi:uncharacterized protein YgiM (DUF1202 family)